MPIENFTGAGRLGHHEGQKGHELGMRTETEGDKARRLLTSLALDTKRKYQTANKDDQTQASELEKSFVALGSALDAKLEVNVQSIDTATPAYDFTTNFGKYEPKPRIRQIPGNPPQFQAAFDEGSSTLGQSSPLEPNLFEIRAVYARTKSETGATFYVCYADTLGSSGNRITEKCLIEERIFVESYLVAQHSHLQAHLTDATHINGRLRDQNVSLLLGSLTAEASTHAVASKTNQISNLSLGSATDRTLLETEAGASLRPSKEVVKGLAERMKVYVEKDTTRTAEAAELQKYIDAMTTQGAEPGPEAIMQILKIAGKPELQNRKDQIKESIGKIDEKLKDSKISDAEKDELREERSQLKKERAVLDSVLAGQTDNTVFELFQDAQEGRMSPELAAILGNKLSNIDDPAAFFTMQVEDLQDKNSLASLLFRHFGQSRGLSEDEMIKKISWLSDFFSKHGQDIAMMGIFAFFQLVTGVIDSAIKNR